MKNQNIAFMLKKKELARARTEAEKLAILQELVQLNPKDSRDLEQRTKFKKELETLSRKRVSSSKGQVSNNPYDGIRYDRQVVIVGEANSGRSTLLQRLTGANVSVSEVAYTTYKPEVGMATYNDVSIQVVELPPVYKGDNDSQKYQFLRNSDVICITARNLEEANTVQSTLEDQLVIVSSRVQEKTAHKYKPKSDIIEKPTFVAAWSGFEINDLDVGDINDLDYVGQKIYQLLHIQRMYSFRNREIEGEPVIFPLGVDVTVKDFANKLGIRKAQSAKIYGSKSQFEGQSVGLSYVLNDGDKVWLR